MAGRAGAQQDIEVRSSKHASASRFASYAGRIMCGYQGWFRAEGDGSGKGWGHFGTAGRFDPDHCTIDIWPDVSVYWGLMTTAIESKAKMIYVAMFDEVDEGTAIFKCTNDPPQNQAPSQFLTNEGLPTDHYLWMTGKAAEMLRGELAMDKDLYLRTDH